jgi:hypothetical protein
VAIYVGGGKYQLNKQQQEEINNNVKGTKKHPKLEDLVY